MPVHTRLNKQLQALVSFCTLRVTQTEPSETVSSFEYSVIKVVHAAR